MRVRLWLVVFVVSVAIGSCGYFRHYSARSSADGSPRPDLEAKRAELERRLSEVSDRATGWPSATDCDATLWAGLACFAGVPIDIGLAEYAPGRIERRPGQACWTEAEGDLGSKSSISNDMLGGYLLCLVARKDLDGLRRLQDYAEAHDYVMGGPFPQEASRVVMSGNVRGDLARAIWGLSGHAINLPNRQLPAVYLPGPRKDFESHVMALGILTYEAVDEAPEAAPFNALIEIDGEMHSRLEELARDYPNDRLYQALWASYTGDFDLAVMMSLDDELPCPDYARGASEAYCLVHRLLAIKVLLDHFPEA